MLNTLPCGPNMPAPGQPETQGMLKELGPRSHEYSAPAVHGSTDSACTALLEGTA